MTAFIYLYFTPKILLKSQEEKLKYLQESKVIKRQIHQKKDSQKERGEMAAKDGHQMQKLCMRASGSDFHSELGPLGPPPNTNILFPQIPEEGRDNFVTQYFLMEKCLILPPLG